MRLEFTIRPTEAEIGKMFTFEELKVDDFLDWLLEDQDKKYSEKLHNAPYFKHRETCDNHYKTLFNNLFTPTYYNLTIRRKTTHFYDFIYIFKFEVDYPIEKFKENLFDLNVLTDAEYVFHVTNELPHETRYIFADRVTGIRNEDLYQFQGTLSDWLKTYIAIESE